MAVPSHGSGSGGSKSSGGKSSGGGGGGGSSAADAYEKAQKKAQKEAEAKAKAQAETLQEQIDALRRGIHTSFEKALKIRLNNFKLLQGQQDAVLVESYNKRLKDLRGADDDNTKATADQSFANLANRGRERANALTEASAQGAGESDILKAQLMSLRNWNQNQSDINRAFFDTRRTVNSSLTDLVADTKTARINNANAFNDQRDAAYTNFFNQRVEAITQLGNVLGQQAALYGEAGKKGDQKDSSKESGKAFDYAAQEVGKAWKNPGAPKALVDWQGASQFSSRPSFDNFENMATNIGGKKKPEGAGLRTWDS